MPWGRRAWHRSSTSSSDGDEGDTSAQTTAADSGGRTASPLGRIGGRRLARGARRRTVPERPGSAQVRRDPASGLEARRGPRCDRPPSERERSTPPRPPAPGSEGGHRTLGRRRDRHRGRGTDAEAHGSRSRVTDAREAHALHPAAQARHLDRGRLPGRHPRRVASARGRRKWGDRSRGRHRRADRERARASRRLQLVHAHPGRDAQAVRRARSCSCSEATTITGS